MNSVEYAGKSVKERERGALAQPRAGLGDPSHARTAHAARRSASPARTITQASPVLTDCAWTMTLYD